ncbi:MAG: endonuclease III [Verrucomicrobiota bacterium]|nr:endonuclease III [Verrucomicrobiota bacterium]MEC7908482.1 endonuclease III [Verrucomicrobiota bacterium]MEC8313530.1 endonuclease III [Verrucomicrobiota bacterium]MEC8517276.1 endonuclease III [Verrucomicrobiota bacterium]MEC8753357.1 endonuclease III [Verrucomicrobiota bacterium]
MNKIERSKVIKKILDELYPSVPIPLNHTDPFTLLVAVLLSAQCTDERVNLVTPALFKIGPTPEEMAKKSISEIHHCIRTCGLANTKAKNVKKLAELLVSRHNSVVPNDFSALEALPGVGHKTASVVMSHAFHIPAFPVDTHIHRLAQRWKLTNGKNVKQTEVDLKKLFHPKDWENLHLQIITYGREYCTARSCFGVECRICKTCFPNRKNPIYVKKA